MSYFFLEQHLLQECPFTKPDEKHCGNSTLHTFHIDSRKKGQFSANNTTKVHRYHHADNSCN